MKSLLKMTALLCFISALFSGSGLMPGLTTPAHADEWSDGDAVKGEKIFKKCAACHTVTEGGPNMIGPHLSGVLGRKAGTISDYQYSSAMRAKGAAGLVWGGQTLFDYLKSPRAYVPGTMMSFAGLAKDDDRRNLIAYLAQANKITGAVPAGEPAK